MKRLTTVAGGIIIAIVGGRGVGLAGEEPVALAVDANPALAGVQQVAGAAPGSTFTVDIVISSVTDLQAFNFELVYNQQLLSAPTIPSGPDVDRNPDANQTFLTSTSRTWSCSPPA